jgi:hemerythrin-like metal-binding protein
MKKDNESPLLPSSPVSSDAIVQAYNRFVPHETLGLLGKENIVQVDPGDHVEKTMTILFADIRDFSTLSEDMTPQENFTFINDYLNRMEPVITAHGGIIDKYLGDGIMALFPTDADDALHGAIAMLETLHDYNAGKKEPIRIGIGLNTGLMMLGVIGGNKRLESTVISDAVNLASRVESMTKKYGTPLLISEHTYYGLRDASHHDIRFLDRVRVKGKKQPQSVHEVFEADPSELREAKRATKALFEEALAYYHFKQAPKALALLEECLRQAPEDTVAQLYAERCRYFQETGYHEGTGEIDLKIEWDESLAIGHGTIDDQHRALFDQVTDFVSSVRQDQDYTRINSVIDFLDNYIAYHFGSEEKCMAEHNYPFLPLQIQQHRRFCRYFAGFKEEVAQNLDEHPVFLLFRTQILVIDWLVNHVGKLDRHFGKFLAQKK